MYFHVHLSQQVKIRSFPLLGLESMDLLSQLLVGDFVSLEALELKGVLVNELGMLLLIGEYVLVDLLDLLLKVIHLALDHR